MLGVNELQTRDTRGAPGCVDSHVNLLYPLSCPSPLLPIGSDPTRPVAGDDGAANLLR